MKIISHRGYWLESAEKNSITAFERSFQLGFGTETDIRDSLGKLVISHDVPTGKEMSLDKFLDITSRYADANSPISLALNIKSDGIAFLLLKQLVDCSHLDYFVFDMSIPDMRLYLNAGVPFFTRMSEIERNPPFLEEAAGVWLDAFESEWYDLNDISNLLAIGKKVCVVSPELHGRPYLTHWEKLRLWTDSDRLIVCTDNPVAAREYFKER